MVAKSTKPERKMPFGPKCKSPKEKEKTCRIRENWPLMCDFGDEASPKDGIAEIVPHITAELDFHARNAESAGSY